MDIDYLIIGQGIAGTLLSHALITAGKKVLVLDHPEARPASLVAGAVINPLSGKHYSPAQDAERFVPAALESYRALEQLLNAPLLQELQLFIFPGNEDEAYAFEQARRSEHSEPYLHWLESRNYETLGNCFHARQGIGVQEPVWQVDAALLLRLWRDYLVRQDAFRAAAFHNDQLEITPEGLYYQDLKAKGIIFCEGAEAADNPLFQPLPFTRNRGDVLLLSIPGLPETGIYHRSLRLVPRQDGLFWCGSNYQWNFKNLEPDEAWREDAILQLEKWLKLPFTLREHIVAARPTTAGQIPLLGRHPHVPGVAIFNGLGTRGFSSGPYWAAALCKLLTGASDTIPGYNKAWFDKQFK